MREQNWNIVFGQPLDALRSAWEARPGGVAIAAGPGVELQKAPLVSAQEKALHDTGRYVRALVAYGKGDQVVHVVSLYGHAGAGVIPEKMRANEQLLRDAFQFLAGLGAVPVMLLADLNITPHLSLAVRSAIDIGGWADCAALVAEATATSPPATCYVHAGPGSRIDVVLANRISKHALCDAGLVGDTGIPTHLPVAAVFQFAEYEQTVTTMVRMRKIDLNFKIRSPRRSSSPLTGSWLVSWQSRTTRGPVLLGNEMCRGSGNYGAKVQKLTCSREQSRSR